MTSFVTIVPDLMQAAAGDLANIQSTLGQATSAVAAPTTGLMPAAADEVSAAVSQLFGSYGEEFQAFSARLAALHTEFMNLLSSSAAAYLGTEIANAQQGLSGGASSVGNAAESILPIVGGSGSGLSSLLGGSDNTGLGGILGSGGLATILGETEGLSSVLGAAGLAPTLGSSGLAATGGSSITQDLSNILSIVANGGTGPLVSNLLTNPFGTVESLFPGLLGTSGITTNGPPPSIDPWQALVLNTSANLGALGADWSTHPFPLLHQIAVNQAGYGQLIVTAFENGFRDFPGGLQVLPGQIEAAVASAQGFNPVAFAEWFGANQGVYGQLLTTSLANAGQDFQTTIPVFESDLGTAFQQLQLGNFNTSVYYVGKAILDLFISGFDTSHLNINLLNFNALVSGPVYLEGPAGALLPILSIPGQELQLFADIWPAGSTAQHMAQHLTNIVNTLTDSSISVNAGLQLDTSNLPFSLLNSTFSFDAYFGLPLALAFGLIGSPITTLNGLATAASQLGGAIQTGDVVGATGVIFNSPAIIANDALNGELLIDVPLPVSESFGFSLPIIGTSTVGFTAPVVAHVPFDGILVPPHAMTATLSGVDLNLSNPILGDYNFPINVPLSFPLGGTKFGGILPELINTMPQALAASITDS